MIGLKLKFATINIFSSRLKHINLSYN